jgi:hypothetical protein
MKKFYSLGTKFLLIASLLLLCESSVLAHWCSNIWVGPARLVVKPEQSTIMLAGTGSATLKVYFQNNFPNTLFAVEMRGNTTLYTIEVAPAKQDVHPGQNVAFQFTITPKSSGGLVPVSDLNLQVKFRYAMGDGFRGNTDPLVQQSHDKDWLINNRGYMSKDGYMSPGQQAPSLSMAVLADTYPSATLPEGAPFFGRTGLQQMIHWFGYRFCYYAEGGWACGAENCPSPCAEGSAWTSNMEFSHNAMRAGMDLASRKSKLGSELNAAREAAVNALKGGGEEFKCLSAIIGAILWEGAADTSPFETALGQASAICKAAGLRALGKGEAGTCTAGTYFEQATCAAAEGLRKNDAPVQSILIPNSGDGKSTQDKGDLWQKSHFYAYMLFLVTNNHYAHGEHPGYYPNVGGLVFPDAGSTSEDTGAVQGDRGQSKVDGQIVPPKKDGSTSSSGGDSGCAIAQASLPAPSPWVLFGLALGFALIIFRRRS